MIRSWPLVCMAKSQPNLSPAAGSEGGPQVRSLCFSRHDLRTALCTALCTLHTAHCKICPRCNGSTRKDRDVPTAVPVNRWIIFSD